MSNDLQIGQTVFVARAMPIQKWVTCPHCFGKRFLTVIMGDDSQVQIECTGCSVGFDGPRGVVESSDFSASVEQYQITGVDSKISKGKLDVMYWSDCSGYSGEDCFATEAEAMARAQLLLDERNKEESRRLTQLKENQDRSWAWNTTYHRDCLKRAKRDVEYHTAKLEICKAKSKQDKIPSA